jgi:cytoskeletal protein CcmA (bactofilin family)
VATGISEGGLTLLFKRRKPDDPEPTMETNNKTDSGSLADKTLLDNAARDSGVGVPPFRPSQPAAPTKDSPMARPPFAGTTPNPPPAPPAPPASPLRPPAPPGPRPAFGQNALNATGDRRTLVVGRGISVQGTVTDAERLVVEGKVEATLINAAELSVSPGGVFKGEIEVEDAEVAGTVDGTIVARGALQVRSTGVVLGTARCRRLQVEDGGQITGRIEMITEAAARPSAGNPPSLQTAHSFET